MQVLKKGKDRDALVGAVVIVTATLLFGFVYGKEMHSGDSGGYTVNARFRRADGISLGSDVRLSGVVVGKVVAEELDQQFRAITTLRLASNLGLPMDTAVCWEQSISSFAPVPRTTCSSRGKRSLSLRIPWSLKTFWI